MQHDGGRRGYLLFVALGTTVLAFMALSLAITAMGTGRFAVAMGYRAEVGYAIGGVFDVAKALLPVALLVLVARRAFFCFAIIGSAWIGLVTYSWLATHATVSAAIATIERNGTWKMESRTNTKTELGDLQHRLAALSQPRTPRPSKSIAEAVASERVPEGVWRDSHECAMIRGSRYFERACAKVLQLRRELAAAQDYERIEARMGELRHTLEAAPIVAIQDPLPRAFTATIGRLVPLDGDVGVAHLLTLVIEIMSCFGLAAVRVIREEHGANLASLIARQPERVAQKARTNLRGTRAILTLRGEADQIGFHSSLKPRRAGTRGRRAKLSKRTEHPSNVVPMPAARPKELVRREAPQGGETKSPSEIGCYVREFIRARLLPAAGTSLRASDVWAAYQDWSRARGDEPLSQQKLGRELAALGFAKWKSCGLIRYRDVRLAA